MKGEVGEEEEESLGILVSERIEFEGLEGGRGRGNGERRDERERLMGVDNSFEREMDFVKILEEVEEEVGEEEEGGELGERRLGVGEEIELEGRRTGKGFKSERDFLSSFGLRVVSCKFPLEIFTDSLFRFK